MALPLRNYQIEFRDAFLRGDTQMCVFDMGLGKSLTSISVARELKARNVLVICPASVVSVWRGEVMKWDPQAQYECPANARGVFKYPPATRRYTIVNPDKLVRNGDLLAALLQREYDLLIVDEAHMFKTPNARRTRVLFQQIAPRCKRILPLTGTPVMNHAAEIYTWLRYLGRDLITGRNGEVMTLQMFENRYCNVEMIRIGGRLIRRITGSRNMPELKERMGSFMFRRTKAEVLKELPPMQYESLPLALSGVDQINLPQIPETDLSGDALLAWIENEEHIARALRQLGTAKAAAFVQFAHDWLQNCDEKMVVWFKHHAALDLAMDGLKDWSPVKIDGRDSREKRDAAVEKFLNDPECRIFIGQIRAAGTGLTLLSPTRQPRFVFFVEQEWNPAECAQAAARVHRIGQCSAVMVYTVVAENVRLDERVVSTLTRKIREIGELI